MPRDSFASQPERYLSERHPRRRMPVPFFCLFVNPYIVTLQADTVYRLGNWEYSYLYRDAPASTAYSALKYGAWVLELKEHMQASVAGRSKVSFEC